MAALIESIMYPLIDFLTRFFFIILVILGHTGGLWMFLDALPRWRRDKSGLPAWAWLIPALLIGFPVPPIYWILRKPRSISRLILAIVIFWIFPPSIPLGRFYVRSRIVKQREARVQEVKIGMTKKEVLSLLHYVPDVDTTFEDTLGRRNEEWEYAIDSRKGWYYFTFVDDSLGKIEFEECILESLRKIIKKQK